MKLKQKTKKNLFFLFILISLTVGVVSFTSPIWFSPFTVDQSNLYITSGDVIRNFKLNSFGEYPIDSSGNIQGLDNRLKVELGAQWVTTPDDVKTLYLEQVGDVVYINYDVTFTRKLNIYTNDRLNDVVDKDNGKTADPVNERLVAALYEHYGCFGGAPQISTKSYLTFTHLDVGDLRTYNAENNEFSGSLDMSFDIDPSPLPDTLVDSNGNTANKTFDYIGVKSVYVKDSTYGLMSNEVPYTVGLTPSQYDTSSDDVAVAGVPAYADSFKADYDPNPILSKTFKSDTFDLGVQTQSIGSYLNPTQKDGTDLFDPRQTEESMTDCKFSYNVGSLSPLVTSYSNTLNYNYQTFTTYTTWYGATDSSQTSAKQSVTRVTALQVSNRYIQAQLAITFTIWSSYNVVAVQSDLPDLQYPQEYYDDLVFSSVVDGFGGGMVQSNQTNLLDFLMSIITSPLTTIMTFLVVVAIVGIVLYVLFKRFKSKSKQPGTNVIIQK